MTVTQIAFGRQFGELTYAHTDVTAAVNPPAASELVAGNPFTDKHTVVVAD
jgi:hypothetical protein